MQGSTIMHKASDIAYAMNARFGISHDAAETVGYQVLVDMLERKVVDVPMALASTFESKFPAVDNFEETISIVTDVMLIHSK